MDPAADRPRFACLAASHGVVDPDCACFHCMAGRIAAGRPPLPLPPGRHDAGAVAPALAGRAPWERADPPVGDLPLAVG
eukprot:10062180-Alexandrium_andersonii.AAC.1